MLRMFVHSDVLLLLAITCCVYIQFTSVVCMGRVLSVFELACLALCACVPRAICCVVRVMESNSRSVRRQERCSGLVEVCVHRMVSHGVSAFGFAASASTTVL